MEIPRGISRKTIGGISEDSVVKLKKIGNSSKIFLKELSEKNP